MTFEEIQLKIRNAKTLDFGSIFSDSIELFKKVWGDGLVMFLITAVCVIPVSFIMYMFVLVPFILIGFTEGFPEHGKFIALLLLLLAILIVLVVSLILMTIVFAIKSAFYRICMQKDLGKFNTDDFFFFMKRKYFGKMLRLNVAILGIELLAVMTSFLFAIPFIYIIVPITFINLIFALNPDLSASEIIKLSFNLGTKKWFISFGLSIVAVILAYMLGLLMCGIGIIVTMPFALLPVYYVYKEVVGFSDGGVEKHEFRYIES